MFRINKYIYYSKDLLNKIKGFVGDYHVFNWLATIISFLFCLFFYNVVNVETFLVIFYIALLVGRVVKMLINAFNDNDKTLLESLGFSKIVFFEIVILIFWGFFMDILKIRVIIMVYLSFLTLVQFLFYKYAFKIIKKMTHVIGDDIRGYGRRLIFLSVVAFVLYIFFAIDHNIDLLVFFLSYIGYFMGIKTAVLYLLFLKYEKSERVDPKDRIIWSEIITLFIWIINIVIISILIPNKPVWKFAVITITSFMQINVLPFVFSEIIIAFSKDDFCLFDNIKKQGVFRYPLLISNFVAFLSSAVICNFLKIITCK